ncbi:MAG TPA: hypothetical protein VGG28_09300 [Kofleriaceae bacterium]|jgi:hypothetical protein
MAGRPVSYVNTARTCQVEIDLGFFPLMWMLLLVHPRVAIDGFVEKRSWGKHAFTLSAGRHVVEAWFPYIFPGKTCRGSIDLVFVAGVSYKLRYRPSWLFFSGKIAVVAQPLLPTATARQLRP